MEFVLFLACMWTWQMLNRVRRRNEIEQSDSNDEEWTVTTPVSQFYEGDKVFSNHEALDADTVIPIKQNIGCSVWLSSPSAFEHKLEQQNLNFSRIGHELLSCAISILWMDCFHFYVPSLLTFKEILRLEYAKSRWFGFVIYLSHWPDYCSSVVAMRGHLVHVDRVCQNRVNGLKSE